MERELLRLGNMTMTKLLSTSLLTLFVSLAAPGAALAADSRAEPSFVQAPEGARRGSQTDQRRYAEKAAESREALNYRGGDTVVISASALAVVLLIVLIVILL